MPLICRMYRRVRAVMGACCMAGVFETIACSVSQRSVIIAPNNVNYGGTIVARKSNYRAVACASPAPAGTGTPARGPDPRRQATSGGQRAYPVPWYPAAMVAISLSAPLVRASVVYGELTQPTPTTNVNAKRASNTNYTSNSWTNSISNTAATAPP